jgi:hypothetical protein
MAFKPNELGQDQNHGIVYSNDLIFFKCMPLGMANNIHFGCSPFLLTKSSFSIFWVWKRIFFELVTLDLRPTWNDNARKLPLVPRRCGFPFFPTCLVKKWHVADPKIIFAKKLGGLVFSAKVQNHPGSSEIGKNLHKIQKIYLKAAATKRELICVSQVVYYLCGVFSLAFDFAFR